MANNFDLEEQEQLDQLKHFWSTWGILISIVLIVIFGAVAAWNGLNYWRSREALQAAALLDAVETAGKVGDQERMNQAFSDIRSKYAGTAQAAQSGLILAKLEADKNNIDAAKIVLEWVAENASDEGYRALAQLRLASLSIEKKSYDNALQQISKKYPIEFDSITIDRRGDILFLQDKKLEAAIEYNKSYVVNNKMEYRKLIEVKLNALGIQPQAIAELTALGVVK